MSAYSVVDWHDGHEGYRCGYCKSPNTNYSHGMSAYNLTVNDYQDLIDRGWRRSGTYVYKPTMRKTCCPQYPIRCDAVAFNLSRSHKKVIKRVNKYLNFGTIPDKDEHSDEVSHPSDYPQRNIDTANVKIESGIEVPILATVDKKLSPETMQNTSVAAAAAAALNSEVETAKHRQPRPGIGADPTKPKCMKAKLQRLERKKLKAKAAVPTTDAVQTDSLNKTKAKEKKSLEDHLGDVIDTPVHKLEVRLVRSSPKSTEFDQHVESSYGVYFKYQTVIHGDPPDKPTLGQYTRFLVESPLQQQEAKDVVLPHGFGSFHQHYILDGKIIAVGVLDILPKCVSSVYLYYDPDYSFLSLGTYSALRELALTREFHRICPEIRHYYLGFYIHSCPKMRYKGQYDPSYLLCPETYSWHKIDECQRKLDGHKYSRFAEAGIDDKDSDVEVNNILVLHQRQVMPYGTYRSKKLRVTDKKSVSLYAHLVGNALTKRILLYRS